MELTARKKQILKVVTERYIDAAEPVGSKFIAQAMGGNLSSATIRNELADLTELGYLEQPHTSAGRIPSPKGYRLYVNELMERRSVSDQEAAAAFRARYEDDELFQGLPDENFRHRYAIDLKDIGLMGQTKADLEAVEGIGPGNVSAYEDEAAGFITIRNVAGIVCVVLIAVLFLVSVFIIANTIKLTTFDRRDEIAIMKMVGATNGFIRWPFVYEGFLLGLFSAVIGFFLQWGLYEAVARSVATNDTINLISVVPFETMWEYVAVIFAAAGIFIGVGGSLSAIRKFLQV